MLSKELEDPVGLCILLDIEDLGRFFVEPVDVDRHV
jgi:hypothetical protein